MAIDPVRVGIIGTTAYAESHMANIVKHPHAVFRAVAGRNRDRTAAIAERFGAEIAFEGYQDLIASGEIDAVLVLAPDELHEPIAMESFAAGLHVLCEKPLATTPAAARRMADAARESGLVNMSYFALRTSPYHHLVKELVDSGVVGQIRSASLSLMHGLFRSPDYNWRFDSTRGGGVIADLGCYLFDQALWFIGDISTVAADGAAFVNRPRPDGTAYAPAADSAAGILHFDSGAHATWQVSVVSHVGAGFQRNIIHLQGDTGRLELDHTFSAVTLRVIKDGEQEYTEVALPDGFAAPSGDAEFIDAIVEGGQVRPSFEDGWRVQRVVAAAEAAAQTGTWVAVEREGGE
ncbi:Gfo/Idh/MocA family oxidoreductase [Microbacterium pumilum]|uniref:Gfo/Idh/MocA family oxidoreductase n=1 Tax=Microbacterium pumilum TaxID=344165 RepID=A0ABN2RP35_9MICO